jgi:hypothetical protein
MQTREPRRIDTADCAKLVRTALKASFPEVKFSVRTERYSGGSSVWVTWTDGPTAKQVEAIAKRYEGADFDGMIDLKTYHDSDLDGERVSFGADWVQCQRSWSPAFLRRCAESAARKWGFTPPVVTDEGVIVDSYERIDDGYTARDLVMQHVMKTATQVK